MQDYIISCCSTADLTKQQLEKLNVNYICFHFELDGKQYYDDLGQSVSFSDFYNAMAQGKQTKTSQVNCEEYEQYEGLYELPGWEDATREYCEKLGISPEELEDTDKESLAIEEYYNEARENWLAYHIVPTEEDDIDQEDLILGYVFEDDSSSQTDSE